MPRTLSLIFVYILSLQSFHSSHLFHPLCLLFLSTPFSSLFAPFFLILIPLLLFAYSHPLISVYILPYFPLLLLLPTSPFIHFPFFISSHFLYLCVSKSFPCFCLCSQFSTLPSIAHTFFIPFALSSYQRSFLPFFCPFLHFNSTIIIRISTLSYFRLHSPFSPFHCSLLLPLLCPLFSISPFFYLHSPYSISAFLVFPYSFFYISVYIPHLQPFHYSLLRLPSSSLPP